MAEAKKKSKVGLFLSMALLVGAAGGMGAWFMSRHGATAEAAHAEASAATPRYVMHLESFTVNLADTEENHFVRATIDLGIDRPPEAGEKEREKNITTLPIARIRDSIVSVLTTYRANTLLTVEGKAQLKKELLQVLTRNVPELGVREIYFTEFLVQR